MFDSFQRSFLACFLGFIAALFVTLMYGWPNSGAVALGVLAGFTVFFTGSIHFLARRYDTRLTQRIADGDKISWHVVLNDVKLGTLTDAEYASAKQRAFRDPRVAGEQVVNLCRAAASAVGRVVILIPFLLFWLFAVLLLVSPTEFSSTVEMLQKADAVTLTAAVKLLFEIAGLIAVMTLGICAALGHDVGVRDCYSEGVNRELRRVFKTAATGDVQLTRVLSDCECGGKAA
jgi:hypothetical protein